MMKFGTEIDTIDRYGDLGLTVALVKSVMENKLEY